MNDTKPKFFLAGLRQLCRRQSLLWWVYFFNLLLALLATRGFSSRAGDALNHSLDASRLLHRVDISALIELAEQPENPLRPAGPAMTGGAVVFFIFMLLATGAILQTYRRDARLNTQEFFESGGRYFWRFLRLALYFLVALIPVAILGAALNLLSSQIDELSISPFPAVWATAIGLLLILFLLLLLRLWFDMAQVLCVTENETRIHRALRVAGRIVRQNFGRLFWLFLRINLVSWAAILFFWCIWLFVLPPESLLGAFLVGQLMVLAWIAGRLWQRSSETLWYQRNAPAYTTWL